MTRNEFQSSLYRTTTEMLDAIAEEWLSAGGRNSEEMQRSFLDESTDTELATEAIDGWGLDRHGDFGEPSHMELNEYTAYDLAAAFGRLRERFEEEEEELAEEYDWIDADDMADIVKYAGSVKRAREMLENDFVGIFNNFEEYAYEFADEQLASHGQDGSFAARYFDYEAFARDLRLDMHTVDLKSGQVAIFWA